ncbi:MAG TPA: N-acetylgalactosamine-6-sulfatase, partial [Phycisphaerae bacterium]|nr:N-acetylgalactosamine-6-sulfatase [Phycisphaerae bacterium]
LVVWSGRIPASAAGTRNDRTVLAGMDLPPSLLALANVAVPEGVRFDGLDMSRALCGGAAPNRDQPVMWLRPPDRPGPKKEWPDLAIREGDWKLLVFRTGSGAELYNIPADPKEANNLAAAHPDLVRRLTDQVIRWDRSIRSRSAEE